MILTASVRFSTLICDVTASKSSGWNIIIDDLHRTIPYLTKYEKTRVLGVRTKQINAGAPIFVEDDPSILDGYLIAEKELMELIT